MPSSRASFLLAAALLAAGAGCQGAERREDSPGAGDGSDTRVAAADPYRAALEADAAGRWQEAVAHLEEALRLRPGDEQARYALGTLLLQRAGPAATVEYCREWVARETRYPQIPVFFWGLALLEGDDPEAAVERFRHALEVDPAHELSAEQWGVALERRGRPEEAAERYRAALEIDPDLVSARRRLADVLERLGRPQEAAAERDLADTTVPDLKRKPFYWGRALLRAGRAEAALPLLEEAVRLDPDNQEAQRLLAAAQRAAGR